MHSHGTKQNTKTDHTVGSNTAARVETLVQRLKRITIELPSSIGDSGALAAHDTTLVVLDPIEHMTVGKRADDWARSTLDLAKIHGIDDKNSRSNAPVEAALETIFDALPRTDKRVARSLVARSISIAPELFLLDDEPIDGTMRRKMRSGPARGTLEQIARSWMLFYLMRNPDLLSASAHDD